MSTALGFVVGLLHSALSLLGFVQANPTLPPVQQTQAVQTVQQAVTVANQAVSNTSDKDTTTVRIDPSTRFTATPEYSSVTFDVAFNTAGIDPKKDYIIYFGDGHFSDSYRANCFQQPQKVGTTQAYACGPLALDYRYETAGTYQAALIVDPGLGQTMVATATITVPAAQESVTVPGMSKYTDSDFGFSFWYPSGWQVTKGNSGSGSFSDTDIRIVAPPLTSLAGTDITLTKHSGAAIYAYQPVRNELSMGSLIIMTYQVSSLPGWFSVSWGSPVKSLDVSGRGNMLPLLRTIVLIDPSVATPVSASEQIKAIQAEKDAYAGQ